MTAISASMVKDLRARTGAGMMDCKTALKEANGNLDNAMDWLRTKGLAAASKKSSRVAAEGLVGLFVNNNIGSLIEVNSETDFVAKNNDFQAFVESVTVLTSDVEDLEALKQKSHPKTGKSVEDSLKDLVASIGENLVLRRFEKISVDKGLVVGYLHNKTNDSLGKIGVLIGLECDKDTLTDEDKALLEQLGKQLAMHVAATNPQALNIESLSSEVVEKERAILTEQAQSSGKPADVIQKMVEGRLRKFYEESVALEQVFVMDSERKVSQVVADTAKQLNAQVTFSQYVRFGLGEGIEKKEEDFASEVAAQLKSG